jgi:hypothetical protein
VRHRAASSFSIAPGLTIDEDPGTGGRQRGLCGAVGGQLVEGVAAVE